MSSAAAKGGSLGDRHIMTAYIVLVERRALKSAMHNKSLTVRPIAKKQHLRVCVR